MRINCITTCPNSPSYWGCLITYVFTTRTNCTTLKASQSVKQKQSKSKNCYGEHWRRTLVSIHCYRSHSLRYPIKVKQNLRPILENQVLFFKKSRDSTTLPWLERIFACTEAQHLAEFSRDWEPERENHRTAAAVIQKRPRVAQVSVVVVQFPEEVGPFCFRDWVSKVVRDKQVSRRAPISLLWSLTFV